MSDDELYWMIMGILLLGIVLFGLFALWPYLFGPIGY